MNKVFIIFIIVITGYLGYLFLSKQADDSPTVTVYVAHDQDYAEPVLAAFEEETGIEVRAVYDTEASKTVGLTNRLIAEKDNPQADVFWNNEVTRSIQLQKEGVLKSYQPENFNLIDEKFKDPDGFWTGFAARVRVLVVNTDLVELQDVPTTLQSLSQPGLAKNTTLADPRFGTTGAHMAALRAVWGVDKFEEYILTMNQNGLNIAQSNGQTRNKVVDGEKWIGFTDTDDANDAIVEGKPIRMVLPDQGEKEIGTLVIPNTAMIIKGAPHQENAKKLIDYLVSPVTESQLAQAKSAQIPLLPNVEQPANVLSIEDIQAIEVTWQEIYQNLVPAIEFFEKEVL